MLPVGEFVFDGQLEHEVAVPVVDLYFPGAHNTQLIPSEVAKDPVLQVHCKLLLAPPGEFVFNGQFEQAAAVPLAGLNFPMPHNVHATPFAVAYEPGLQLH